MATGFNVSNGALLEITPTSFLFRKYTPHTKSAVFRFLLKTTVTLVFYTYYATGKFF